MSLQELILPLLLLGLLILISTLNPHVYYGGISTMELERDDHFVKGLGYTPITNITNHIMEEVAQELRECSMSLSSFRLKSVHKCYGEPDFLNPRLCVSRHAGSSGDVCQRGGPGERQLVRAFQLRRCRVPGQLRHILQAPLPVQPAAPTQRLHRVFW